MMRKLFMINEKPSLIHNNVGMTLKVTASHSVNVFNLEIFFSETKEK